VKDDRLYLLHISESLERIEEYVAEGKGVFFADRKTQDAVLRNLQILAESSQRLSEPLKASRSELDWRGIAGLRNILVHDYLGISLPRVWEIVEVFLPQLKAAVCQWLETWPSPRS
jgi:uncharacterized protein with HEPN domain